MKFVSTRNAHAFVTLSDAITAGLAPDGGLFVPSELPALELAGFDPSAPLADTAARLLSPFFAEDSLSDELGAICAEAFALPLPLQPLHSGDDYALELFHGPTAAFKDFGARFLASTMERLLRSSGKTLTIIVATSGDTGAAVAAAFHRRAGVRVVILYPEGRVSPRQAHQLECFGDNIETYRITGSFDDCQRLAKQALADRELQDDVPLSSANSISLGRLLPQMAYYAHASIVFARDRGEKLSFVIPTGNLGNAVAAILARRIGIPIGEIVLATNANEVLRRFFHGGEYEPGESVPTLANAMDVGAPSNFERLRWLYGGDDAMLRSSFRVFSVSDEEIRSTIRSRFERFGELFCPHTATAVHTLEHLRADGVSGAWAVVATAHPAKFDSIVEPLIGRPVEVPPALAELLHRPTCAETLPPDYALLREKLRS